MHAALFKIEVIHLTIIRHRLRWNYRFYLYLNYHLGLVLRQNEP